MLLIFSLILILLLLVVAQDCFFGVGGMMLVLNQQELTQDQFATEKVQFFKVFFCKFSNFFLPWTNKNSAEHFLMFFLTFFFFSIDAIQKFEIIFSMIKPGKPPENLGPTSHFVMTQKCSKNL